MKAFLIARVSDPEQRKALPAQKQKLFEYAERMNFSDPLYVEFDETAYKDTRKKFQELVVTPLLASSGMTVVVFDKIDRYTRDSSSELKTVLNDLRKDGKIELHFPSDNLLVHKSSPAADLFRLDIGIALAGYYSSAIRDNVKRRFDQKLNDGEWPGKAPIGYLNVVVGQDSKGENIKEIIPDPDREHLIRKGFEMRANGASFEAIAKHLKKEGLTANTKRRGPIGKNRWEELIRNPFYYGVMRFDGSEYPHKYRPLIPRWLWDKCQAMNKDRGRARLKTCAREFVFKGLKCAECGYSVVSDTKKGYLTYLKCTEYGGKHNAPRIREEKLLAQIDEILKSIKVPQDLLEDIVEELQKGHRREQEFYKQNTTRLRKESDQIDGDIKIMYQDRLRGRITVEQYDELLSEAKQRQLDIAEQLKDHVKADESFLVSASYLLDLSNRAVELFNAKSSTVEQKRQLLNFVLSNLRLKGEKLLFNLKEPFDAIAECSNNNNWLHGQDSNL